MTVATGRWIGLLIAALGIFFASAAAADDLRPGYLEFAQQDAGRWHLVWKVPLGAGIGPHVQPVLPAGCRIAEPPRRETADSAVLSRYLVACSRDVAGSKIGLSGLSAARSDILVRVSPLGRPVQAMRLTATSPTAEIRARPDGWQVARTYFVTGFEHILSGADHLLFVIALVLLVQGAWRVTVAVTAFTLAHSITLVGTTLGAFDLPQRPVEAMIALSIVFLAVEIAKRGPDRDSLTDRRPWIVAFVFGLLHGFGFAGALREIGLPESDVPTALVTFNLGVEAGQLVIVVVCMAVLAGLRWLSASAIAPATRVASYAIGTVASYWLIERMM